jgi:peptidoglycan-associated lipoprotein
MEDMTEPVLPDDIAELNAYVAEQGLVGDVYFDFDQADLRADARQRLEQNAQFMRQHPEYTYSIEGHCDDRGTNEYNLALGQRRAETTKDYLVSLGIQGSSLRTISYGEERPVCTEQSETCWQRNRRAHFVITGRQ